MRLPALALALAVGSRSLAPGAGLGVNASGGLVLYGDLLLGTLLGAPSGAARFLLSFDKISARFYSLFMFFT